MIDMRTVIGCPECQARARDTQLLPRIVIDHGEVPFTLLGCPLCGSHDLRVERTVRASVPPPASGPVTTPPPASSAPPPLAAGASSSAPTAPPAVTMADPVTRAMLATGAGAAAGARDFIPQPSRVTCAQCGRVLTFDVSERMTDALERAGWRTEPGREGVLCDAHPKTAPPPSAASEGKRAVMTGDMRDVAIRNPSTEEETKS